MQNNYKNIIFDLGGVLIDWNPRYMYHTLFDSNEEMEFFLRNICTDAWNLQQDAGRTLEQGTKILCEQFPEYTNLIRAFYERWHEMLNGAIPETVALLKQLKQTKINLYALTNWSHETFPYARKKFEFLNDFIDIVVSGEEKIVKPDRRIYEILLNRNNLKTAETIFIDDNQKNVVAAVSLGMCGIHFVGAKQLKNNLAEILQAL